MFVTSTGNILKKDVHDRVSLALAKILDGPEENEIEGPVGSWAAEKFQEQISKCPLDPNDKSLDAAVLDWIHRFQECISYSYRKKIVNYIRGYKKV